MKTTLAVLCLGLGLLSNAPAAAKLNVVATHADLAALAREVGGQRVDVVAIVEPTQDPHFVDPRPHLMLQLNRADLLLLVGLQLEIGWLPTLITGARNARILPGSAGYLDTSTLVERRDVRAGPVDRSQGDLHPGGNPHFSRAPESGLRIAEGIAQRLSELDPAGASDYRRNFARFDRRLRSAMTRWQEACAPYRGTAVVAYHESWVYFAEWLGLRVVGYVEPKPGIPADPAHVAALLTRMRAERVRAILQEEYYPDTTARLLAAKAGARVLRMPGGVHLDQPDGYEGYVGSQVQALLGALGPSAAPEVKP